MCPKTDFPKTPPLNELWDKSLGVLKRLFLGQRNFSLLYADLR